MISLGILTYNTAVVNSFSFQVVTTAPGETVTLPILAGGASYVQNFTAYWGDTTSSEITAYNDPDRIHTYAVAGTYDIQLIGISQYFCYSSTTVTERNKVKKLLGFNGDIGFKVLNFYGCINLNTIVSFGTLVSLINVSYLFQNCTSLPAIINGMFDGCPNILYFSDSFAGCTNASFTSIPTDLFRYNTAVTTFTNIFNGCTKITSIPTDLFRYNVSVTSFQASFQNCSKITSIPTDLFRYNSLVTNFSYTFNGCSLLTVIPIDLFRYNVSVTNFTYVFGNCNALTTLPNGLFDYNVSVTSFQAAFYQCAVLATLPVYLFRYNTAVTNFYYAIASCPKLQLNSDIFYAVGEQGTRFLNKSMNFYGCFDRSSFTGIIGIAPDLWNCNFGTGTPTKTLCFGGAGNNILSLLNYLLIPVAWK